MTATETSSGATVTAARRNERLTSLDAFRGFLILAMVFVNYLAGMAAIPFMLQHAAADQDLFTLADVVFPGFLFVVGVSIPLALTRRKAGGAKTPAVVGHIFIRALALLFLGVLLVNENLYSTAAAGIDKDLWYFLAILAVITLWAVVPTEARPQARRIHLVFKVAAAVGLLALVIIFRGQGPDGQITWLQTSWWGILGIIGWCYLAGCLLYLACRGNRTILAAAIGMMAALYIGGRYGALDFLGPVNEFVDIGSLFGSYAAIVTAGMLAGTFFLPGTDVPSVRGRISYLVILGTVLLAAGFVLRPLHGFSKIQATESYCLATAGISALVFLLFYLSLDVLNGRKAAAFLLPAGRNPLLAYLLPFLIMSAAAVLGGLVHLDIYRILWPFYGTGGLTGILNAAAMTGVVLLLTAALSRAGLVLKL
jgi:predicted acyltransferase